MVGSKGPGEPPQPTLVRKFSMGGGPSTKDPGEPPQPTLVRKFSMSAGPSMPTALASSPSVRRLSALLSVQPMTKPPPQLHRSNSTSDGSKRRITPVQAPHVITSSGSFSRRNTQPVKSHPSQSRYSNKSARDDHPKGDEPYAREEGDVEVEELNSRMTEMSTAVGHTTRHATGGTLKKLKLDWAIDKAGPMTTSSESQPSSPSPSKLRVPWGVSPSAFLRRGVHSSAHFRLACWLGVLTIHCLCTMLYSLLAAIHAKLPHTKLGIVLPQQSPRLLNLSAYSKAICGIASCLAVLHGAVVVRMLRQSLATRQLMYYAPNYFNATRSDRVVPFAASIKALTGAASPSPHPHSSPPPSVHQILGSLLFKAWLVLQELLWARRDLVVLNYTPPSERMFRVTIVCQTAAHLMEALVMSRQVASTNWLQPLYVSVIIINALLPFFLTVLRNTQFILWHSHRITSLLSSAALDAIAVLVVPVILIHRYKHAYDPSQESFSPVRWFCDQWLMEMLLDVEFLLAMAVGRSLLRLVLGLHLLCSLNALKSLLESVTSSRPPIPSTERSVSGSPVKTSQLKLIKIKAGTRFSLLLEVVLLVLATITLAAHWHAQVQVYPLPSCPLAVRPWFSRTPFCPLLVLHCEKDPLVLYGGNGVDLDTILSPPDASSVERLVIRNCPSVEITQVIYKLPNLVVFKIKNSTLSTWPQDAALTQAGHPEMRQFAAINVSMVELPDGLLSSDFPTKLSEIGVYGSNLSTLPMEITVPWRRVAVLMVELSQLASFPRVLLQMEQLTKLSLTGNDLSSVPKELFELPQLEQLFLNGNPIDTLPLDVDVDPSSPLTVLAMDATLLSALPTWATAKQDLKLFMGSTPFCDQMDTTTLAQLNAMGVSCTPLADGSLTMFPLLTEEEQDG